MKMNQKVQISSFIRGHLGYLSVKLMLFRLCRIMLMFYILSSIYLLIIDTSFIAQIRLYEIKYMSVVVCFLTVIVGFVLFLLTVKLNMDYKFSLISAIDNCQIKKININALIKYSVLKAAVLASKIIYITVCVLPSVVLTAIIYNFMQNGVSVSGLIVLTACNVIILFSGLFNSVCLIQKFAMCDCCFAENQCEAVLKIIKLSSYLMDGRCDKTAVYKLRHFHFKLLGFVFPVFTIREAAREFIVMTDKIIPYVHSRAHTEKSVVFYVGKTVTS